MSISISADGVRELAADVWEMAINDTRLFGSALRTGQGPNVLLVKRAQFDRAQGTLLFTPEDTTLLNQGTIQRTIVLHAPHSTALSVKGEGGRSDGDVEFLNLSKRLLSDDMSSAAEQLLAGVRERFPGNLKRGKNRNFSDTPDNFWYVIVQPRVNELSITVRGPVEHFEGLTRLVVKDDRGNTRFKVSGTSDVPEALKLIQRAKRKEI